jgi:hypothetical protein
MDPFEKQGESDDRPSTSGNRQRKPVDTDRRRFVCAAAVAIMRGNRNTELLTKEIPMLAIPEINRLDMAFGNIKHMPRYDTLPAEFKRHNGNAYCEAVSKWFFSGAKGLPNGIEIDGVKFVAKPGVEAGRALAAIKAVLTSFEPKHEHKEAACAFMLSEWFEKK